ncbi:lipase chaperone [Kitasatospora phosalacinea]|uniref:lipase chaperone n=1 Tax=Kitasatospora phosalacinea TaxID=2065 RepID=UPI00052561CE|nr:lipase chaperone [Kitasatospora phosalacinea]
MRVRKFPAIALVAVAACLSLTACEDSDPAPSRSSASAPASSSAASPTAPSAASPAAGASATPTTGGKTPAKSSSTPKASGTKCTDQLDYAGDSRSNAEINSIGDSTGTCPPVKR